MCWGSGARPYMRGGTVRKRRREGNEWAAGVERRYTIQRTIRWLSRTAVRWGPQFSSSAPPRSPLLPSTLAEERVLKAVRWFNRANSLHGDENGAILDLSVAFETLLGL